MSKKEHINETANKERKTVKDKKKRMLIKDKEI